MQLSEKPFLAVDRSKIQAIFPIIQKLRRTIHKHPELSFQEDKTSKLIAETLKSWGYDTQIQAGTGVIVILDSRKPGKTVALRADMDALPILEKTNLAYQSENSGVMHACGHDGHIAALLMAAYLLRDYVEQFKGKIKFIFQPAEERGHGAYHLVQEGVLANPSVDAIFCYHNLPSFPKNKIILRSQCIMAGSLSFTIQIQGKGGHASAPDKAIDPINIGCHLIQALQNLASAQISPFDPTVLTITQFHSGTATNVIPETALLNGMLRFTKNEVMMQIKEKIAETANRVTEALGGKAKIDFLSSIPPTINSKAETDLVRQIATHLYGKENVIELENNLMATEDFAFYLNQIHGCLFFVGGGIDKPYLHHSDYVFDDDLLPVAAEMLATTALCFLRGSN